MERVDVDFGAAGTIADPMVTVEDVASTSLLYRLRTIDDGAGNPTFATVRVETLAGDDQINVDPDADVSVIVDAGGPIGRLQQPVGDVLNVVTGGAAFLFAPGPEGDEGSVIVSGVQPVSFDHVELLQIDGDNYILADEFDQPDAVVPANDSIATATVLGSLAKITLRDLTLHDTGSGINEDYFQITAQDTGKLAINVFFEDAQGNIDIQVVDADGNLIDFSDSDDNDEQLVIPVVSQEQYFLHVYSVGDGEVGARPNLYNVEIENFAAPVPDAVVLDPTTTAARASRTTSRSRKRLASSSRPIWPTSPPRASISSTRPRSPTGSLALPSRYSSTAFRWASPILWVRAIRCSSTRSWRASCRRPSFRPAAEAG